MILKAFTRLKTSLPWVPADTKLSKLDTLRLAASYISHLRQILAEDQVFPSTSIHPLNLVSLLFNFLISQNLYKTIRNNLLLLKFNGIRPII